LKNKDVAQMIAEKAKRNYPTNGWEGVVLAFFAFDQRTF